MDPVIDVTIRAALALLFVVAATHKLRDLSRFRATLEDYRLLPARFAAPLAIVVPAAEATVAALLAAPAGTAAGKLGAAALLAVYAIAVGVNLARGRRHIDCGCAGPAARRPIGGWLVVRNAVVAAVALAALVPLRPRTLVWVDALTVSGAILALASLYLAADRLASHAPAIARLRSAT